MTRQRAEQLIVISLFILILSEVGNGLVTKGKGPERKKSLTRRITGGFLTMFFAAIVAEAVPEIGALLAIAVASYAFFHDGLPAINKGYRKEGKLSRKEFEREKFPATPGPEVTPLPLGESSPIEFATLVTETIAA